MWMRNNQWSVASSLRITDFVCRWCLHFPQQSLLYSPSRMRITAARTMPYENIKSSGKLSCRRTLVKAPALPLHFGFWATQYLYSRSDMPLSFKQRTLKHVKMLLDQLDSTVSCQYAHNFPVMVCQLLHSVAVLTLTHHNHAVGLATGP